MNLRTAGDRLTAFPLTAFGNSNWAKSSLRNIGTAKTLAAIRPSAGSQPFAVSISHDLRIDTVYGLEHGERNESDEQSKQ